jgi:SWI/SNF-related matrix-associated actin-dependent regulator of chromatin subfamily A member 5
MAHQFSGPKREKKKEPKLPKFLRLPRLEEWQMFDREALYALQDIEENNFKNLPEEQQKLPAAAWVSSFCKSSQTSDTLPECTLPPLLSDEQTLSKKKLLADGFPDWGRHHYLAFVRACAKFGRNSSNKIASEVGKPLSSIESYSAAFWDENVGKKRFSDHEYDRIVKLIERGEKKIEEASSLERCLSTLISLFENPWNELELTNTQYKDKAFTAEEDRYLICWTHKYGYGQWEAIKMAIRLCPAFRFDYFLRSLPAEAIGKRCEQLLRAVEREVEHLERNVREERGTDGAEEKNLENVKLPMYKTILTKKRYDAERDYEIQRMDLEKKVEDIESQIEEIQKKLRGLDEPVVLKTTSTEVPEELVPELVNLVARSGSTSISSIASDFISSYPGQMTKKQVCLKIEEVAKKEKREDEGDTKMIWHIVDEYSHFLDVETLRFLRKQKEVQLDSRGKGKHRNRPESREREQDIEQMSDMAYEGPPKTFPKYDPSEQPKECKKAFTHFCIHTRRDVKASLNPKEVGDKVS